MSVSSCCSHSGGGDGDQGCSETGGASATTGGSATPSGGSSASVQSAISQMESAFDQAIQTNAEITSIKTLLGSVETLAQQRPNIG
jgi:hypothetical protein